jgi:hypothetical protein
MTSKTRMMRKPICVTGISAAAEEMARREPLPALRGRAHRIIAK